MKIQRNDLCPCGSGKKYKFCCLSKKDKFDSKHFSIDEYLKKSNSIELIKIFSVLQLIPENSTKIIRLEDIQHKIIENINLENKVNVDFKQLEAIVHSHYSDDWREDPAENCFSENIIFSNGNNTVFPGITNNVTEINQLILDALFLFSNVSVECKEAIKEGALFTLYLHNHIAEIIQTKRYEYIEDYKGNLNFGNTRFINNFKNLFELDSNDIEVICRKFNIKTNIINEFTSDYKKINSEQGEESVLFRKPFICINDKFYLVLPSSQMYSLNYFIKSKISEYKQESEFKYCFSKAFISESQKALLKMDWRLTDKYPEITNSGRDVWKFDINKYAIVEYLVDSEGEGDLNDILSKIDTNEDELILLSIYVTHDVEFPSLVRQLKIDKVKYQTIMSLYDLQRLDSLWELDKLSVWKYLKAKENAEQEGLSISPFFTILTYYSWFKRNNESFYPTDEPKYNFLNFSFDIQGNSIIEALQKTDKHSVLFMKNDGKFKFVPVEKNATYAPIYISDSIYGEHNIVLEKYSFPIWIINKDKFQPSYFSDAIVYWLNEMFTTLNKLIPNNFNTPITIELEYDKSLFDLVTEEVEKNNHQEIKFDYSVNPYLNKVFLKIPVTIFNALKRNDNYGEIILMESILKALSMLFEAWKINISEEDISQIISDHIPLGQAKMIITGSTLNDIQLDNRYLIKTRYTQKADISLVLENLVAWLEITIPEKIESKEEKEKLCNDVINILIEKIKELLNEYNTISLLEFLMLRHESVINENAFKAPRAVTNYLCFHKYHDTLLEYINHQKDIVSTSLNMRCLIEFAVAEPYSGRKIPNDDDVDFLLAIMDTIIYFGTTKDIIKFDLDNPEMGLLPSGRIGVNKDYFDKVSDFSLEYVKDEHINYSEWFSKNPDSKEVIEDKSYYEKIDNAFIEEFGITLSLISDVFFSLSHHCLNHGNSFIKMNISDFETLLSQELKLEKSEVESIFKHFTLIPRGNIGLPPDGYEFPDIFPWRFNRKLSYLLKPFILIDDQIIYSARHISVAEENFTFLFFTGSLKVDKKYKKIVSLLADRNNKKGKAFRNQVCQWLSNHITHLQVVPYEFKIPKEKKGKDLGDIDILAFDNFKKIIYSIECKNTKLAKIAYEFNRDSQNYIEKQLPKHLNRHNWLEKNLLTLNNEFKIDFSNYRIQSMVISSNQLPIKMTNTIDSIDFFSLNELKRVKYF